MLVCICWNLEFGFSFLSFLLQHVPFVQMFMLIVKIIYLIIFCHKKNVSFATNFRIAYLLVIMDNCLICLKSRMTSNASFSYFICTFNITQFILKILKIFILYIKILYFMTIIQILMILNFLQVLWGKRFCWSRCHASVRRPQLSWSIWPHLNAFPSRSEHYCQLLLMCSR